VLMVGFLIFVSLVEFFAGRRKRTAAVAAGASTGELAAERADIADRYARLLRAARWLGPAQESETPAEYAQRLKERLATEQMLSGVAVKSDAVDLVTKHFALARWGDDDSLRPLLPESAAAESALRAFTASVGRARLRSLARSLGIGGKRRLAGAETAA
jgi:hypothetical protein